MSYVAQRLAELGRRPREPSIRKKGVGKTKYLPGTTEKPCKGCRIVKPLDAFMVHPHGALGRHPRCNECRRITAKAYTKANREAKSARPRPDTCECCGRPPTRRALHWDHDHERGGFRGWLCHGCNIALGAIDDDITRLEQLIAYVKRHGGPA
jgi:hypothetical protein